MIKQYLKVPYIILGIIIIALVLIFHLGSILGYMLTAIGVILIVMGIFNGTAPFKAILTFFSGFF